ncbi:MAG: hypothetical protein FD126_1040 [Elusimicrobia bacterium]|nr:MAG: hypothetical protein FD126_1040 [Elusimicrobiota bacterium]
MAMPPPKAARNRPLDWLFAAPSHIGVLRAIKDSPEGMSGRAVARAAGLNHEACRMAIARLETIGVITRVFSDRTQFIRLNRANELVIRGLLPLFRAEAEVKEAVHSLIRDTFRGRARGVTVFGSVARGEQRPESDLDLLVVIDGKDDEAVHDRAFELRDEVLRRYGLSISPLVVTLQHVRKKARSGNGLYNDIAEQGLDLLDETLGDLIR